VRPENLHLIVQGWAARYKMLPDGSRQMLAILIPGDFCDIHVTILGQMDHGIVALTACDVAYVNSYRIDQLTSENSKLTRALWWATLVDEGVLRSWIVNHGRRDAYIVVRLPAPDPEAAAAYPEAVRRRLPARPLRG
jgi:CRP-like cAMP-binding protein